MPRCLANFLCVTFRKLTIHTVEMLCCMPNCLCYISSKITKWKSVCGLVRSVTELPSSSLFPSELKGGWGWGGERDVSLFTFSFYWMPRYRNQVLESIRFNPEAPVGPGCPKKNSSFCIHLQHIAYDVLLDRSLVEKLRFKIRNNFVTPQDSTQRTSDTTKQNINIHRTKWSAGDWTPWLCQFLAHTLRKAKLKRMDGPSLSLHLPLMLQWEFVRTKKN